MNPPDIDSSAPRPAGTGSRGQPIRVPIREELDVTIARRTARELAVGEGCSESTAAAIVTAVSEVARNIVVHAGSGEVSLSLAGPPDRRAVVVVARDQHPGIADVERVMQDGYSTRGTLGLGLPSARRLMDAFTLRSAPGKGTTVVMKKWVH